MVNAFIIVTAVAAYCLFALAMVLRAQKPRTRIGKDVRRVRLHLQSGVQIDRKGGIEQLPGVTIEGLLAGTRAIGSIEHYVLYEPRVLEKDGSRVVGTTASGHMEVPVARVEAVEAMPSQPLNEESG